MQHGVKSGRTVQQNGLDYANPHRHSWVSPEGKKKIPSNKKNTSCLPAAFVVFLMVHPPLFVDEPCTCSLW